MNDRTRQDLELYVDGELPAERADELTEALRCDHELRAQLSDVTRLDDIARQALTEPVEMTRRPAWARMGALAAAAVLVLGVLVWMVIPTGALREHEIVALATPRPRHESAEPVRLIASIRVSPRPAANVTPEVVVEALPAMPALPVTAGLDDALARGAVDEVVQLLGESSEEERVRAYRRIATLIYSARSAESVLDRLPPARQLEVCRLWADDPQLRPVIFNRLRMLAADETIADEHAGVIELLAEDAHLDPWLRSYDLIDVRRRTG